MNHFLSFIFFSFLSSGYAQTFSANLDTTSVNDFEIRISLELTGPIDSLASFTIEHTTFFEQDTLRLFTGTYSIDEGDPSAFSSFVMDEVNNKVIFGLGVFEKMDFSTRIIIVRREENTTEEININ